jgi:hypothetical protein
LIKRHIIWIVLAAQAVLLGYRLDLLPIWGDERYTLETSARSPGGIVRALRVDVHPPFYYFLVKAWLKLPLPGSPLDRARALSALVALLATLAFYLLWLRPLPFERQILFFSLWVFSPFLLLYARMARSYTLQLLLALIAIRLARDWLRSPADAGKMASYAAAAIALLYTHYLPGLAVVAGTAALGLWRRQWQHAAGVAAIALAYLPWLGTLIQTSSAVMRARPYWVSSNAAVENGVKLAYSFAAFHFGESIPAWAMLPALLVLPGILWSLWEGWRRTKRPPVLFLLIGAIGYLGAASWVTFPFVGARLLFLLPFYYLFLLRGMDVRRWHGAFTYVGLLLIACGGLVSYYHKRDFLNKGYLVDFAAISRDLEQISPSKPALVLLDRQISNAGYYLHPNFPCPVVTLEDDPAFERALLLVHHRRPVLIWYLRYGRDLTPQRLHQGLERHLAASYSIERLGFVPFSRADLKMMQILGLPDRPAHLIEVLILRRRDACCAPTGADAGLPIDRQHGSR